MPIIRYLLFLTILFNIQKLSISPGNRSIDNPGFLSWCFRRHNLKRLDDSNFKNLHVYYEKDNLCYLLKLLNNIKILKTVFFLICLKSYN